MKRPRKKQEFPKSSWTTSQDSYLIEHNSMSNDELAEHLKYSIDEIIERKELLGLLRRAKQMRKGV